MSKKVLLVDDSRTALMLTGMILTERTCYEVITANNGDEAVACAIAQSPDLILMDVVMPKKNGFEACEELRRNPATANVPVILLTTRGEAECVETGFIAGCTEYLTKPVNPDDLVQVLEAYLGE
jgi:CheY-like chemotaxis protein